MYEISHFEHDEEIDKQLELMTKLQEQLENEEKKLFALMRAKPIFATEQARTYN